MINTEDLIGRRKYEALKAFDFDDMSAEELVYFRKTFKISAAEAIKKINDYENHTNIKSNTKANQEYFERLNTESKTINQKLDKFLYGNRFYFISKT